MYHIGKVVEIFSSSDKEIQSAEATVQATVEMWDDNIITFQVHPKLAGRLKEDDFVLVDYTPLSEKVPLPKNLIVKVLRGTKGQAAWDKYRNFHRSRAAAMPTQGQISPGMFR